MPALPARLVLLLGAPALASSQSLVPHADSLGGLDALEDQAGVALERVCREKNKKGPKVYGIKLPGYQTMKYIYAYKVTSYFSTGTSGWCTMSPVGWLELPVGTIVNPLQRKGTPWTITPRTSWKYMYFAACMTMKHSRGMGALWTLQNKINGYHCKSLYFDKTLTYSTKVRANDGTTKTRNQGNPIPIKNSVNKEKLNKVYVIMK